MAYVQNEDELKQGGTAGGQVLAGSGGAGGASPAQAAGSGFTNLQTYLTANKGQGQGLANEITQQGQAAVDTAKAKANTDATNWADAGVKSAENAANTAANTYNSTTEALKADPNYQYGNNVWGTTYGGPQTAQDFKSESNFGVNDLDKAYQNVKNTASSFANDRATQQAGLQQKYGYGAGFAALDTFLGRQDGRDKIQGWAAGVDPGSAQGQIDRVNQAIAGGKQTVATAQSGFEQANRDAKAKRDELARPTRDVMKVEAEALVQDGRGIVPAPAANPPPAPAPVDLGSQVRRDEQAAQPAAQTTTAAKTNPTPNNPDGAAASDSYWDKIQEMVTQKPAPQPTKKKPGKKQEA